MDHLNIFCLPFAGGSSYSYKGFQDLFLPSNLKIKPIELPGRGRRMNESLLFSIDEMADDVWKSISGSIHEPYAIYGHSMGTLIGYELTKKIIKYDAPKPIHLFFSGAGGPSVRNNEEQLHRLPRKEFINAIRKFGGSTDEILKEDSIMDVFEPILRADFVATENFEYKQAALFDIPITCLIGLQERTTKDDAMAWKKETTGALEVIEYPGNHFFIFEHLREIFAVFQDALAFSVKKNEMR
jgi:surfactin synthase thioesterase subunit